MKLKKQQMIIIGVVIVVILLIASVAVVLITGDEGKSNGNGNMNGDNGGNNGGTNGGDGDDVDDSGGSSQLTDNWINLSSNINAVATECGSLGHTDYSDIFFIDEDEGWVTSSCVAEIYHTTDGGITWEVQTTQYPTYAIWMLNEDEGYAGGTNGRVYRTIDGGDNWNAIGGFGITLTDISFFSESSTGFACGLNSAMAKISPEGVTMIEKITYGDLDSVSATGPDEAFFCGGNLLLHYIGNNQWGYQDQGLGGKEYIDTIFMLNNKQGWAAGSDVIINTVDGQNWSKQTSPKTDEGMYDIYFLNVNEGWIVGTTGLVMHTTNGGATWTVEGKELTTSFLTGIHAPSSNICYICGNDGTLLKYDGN